MSKKLAVILVDESNLSAGDLELCNKWTENLILNRAIWARTTDQLAVAFCSSQNPFELIVAPGSVNLNVYKQFKHATHKPAPFDGSESIWQAHDLIVAHCKKLKFAKTVIYFGKAPKDAGALQDSLKDQGVDLVLFDEEQVSLQDFCSEYMPKVIAPYKSYTGTLTLGAEGNRLEMGVMVYTATKVAAAPTFTRVYESNGKLDQVASVREKQVDGVPVEDHLLSSGFMYGSEIVTVPIELKDAIRKPQLSQGFEILGFCAFNIEACISDSSFVVPDADESREIMSSLVRSMFYAEVVAIARYMPPRGPLQLVFLQPYISEAPDMLLMTAAPMAEDFRRYKFQNLENVTEQPTETMLEAVDEVLEGIKAQFFDDFIVPDAGVDRRMDFIRSVVKGEPKVKEHASVQQKQDSRLDCLGVEEVVLTKQIRHEEDLVADEQELDLDDLLG